MAHAGPSTRRSTEPDTTPRRELAGVAHTLARLRALDETTLAAHAGELRAARTVLVDVLERALGRRASAGWAEEAGPSGSGEAARIDEPGEAGVGGASRSESSLEYVEPETWRRAREEGAEGAPGAAAGQRGRLPAELASELRALQREKWLLAFNHIRECEAAQRRDRRELVAALVEARSSTQRRGGPRRSRYRTPSQVTRRV